MVFAYSKTAIKVDNTLVAVFFS